MFTDPGSRKETTHGTDAELLPALAMLYWPFRNVTVECPRKPAEDPTDETARLLYALAVQSRLIIPLEECDRMYRERWS